MSLTNWSFKMFTNFQTFDSELASNGIASLFVAEIESKTVAATSGFKDHLEQIMSVTRMEASHLLKAAGAVGILVVMKTEDGQFLRLQVMPNIDKPTFKQSLQAIFKQLQITQYAITMDQFRIEVDSNMKINWDLSISGFNANGTGKLWLLKKSKLKRNPFENPSSIFNKFESGWSDILVAQ